MHAFHHKVHTADFCFGLGGSSTSIGRNEHWTISRITNPRFTGRDRLVAEMVNLVQQSLRGDACTGQARIVVTGMGGQGKSEICLHVADEVRSW